MDQYQEKRAKCNGARVGHAYVCSFLFVCVFTYVWNVDRTGNV